MIEKKEYPKVGDFYYTSWGYDQTNIEFYQIVGFTPSGKSVRIRRVSTGYSCEKGFDDRGECVPIKDDFIEGIITKRMDIRYNYSIRFTSYKSGSLWDNKPKYWSSYY